MVKLFSNYKKLSIYGWQLCDFDSSLLILWLRLLLLLLLSLLLRLSNKNFQTLSALLCFAHKVLHVRFYFKNILLKKPKSFPWEQIIAPLKDMNIIFQPTKSISYHNKVRWITKDASEEFDMIIGRYDSVGERNNWIIHVGRF